MATLADRIRLQHRLFAELSRMFGREVPLYDKSLLVNRACNRAVCDLLGRLHVGFVIDAERLERTSGERHGALRVGTPEEYRWVKRLFGVFAMEPHNFYDMTDVGAKSQPVIATAFRSAVDPEHRVFCSLLMTDWFDEETKARIDARLARREIFSARAKELIERCECEDELRDADANALIAECTARIFRWTGLANDHALYRHLCDAGFKIAADIACFRSHHLNHLTPNTLWIDLYVAAMRLCLGEIEPDAFVRRATVVLGRLARVADGHWMRLHFRHLSSDAVDRFVAGEIGEMWIVDRATALATRLREPDLDLRMLEHSGSKDLTEGPPQDTPVLLRQDAYKALAEPVRFEESDGTFVDATHTARFGEIEQRFWATTPKGRALYDRCLADAEEALAQDPGLAKRDFDAYERRYAEAFAPFPKTLPELLEAELVYGRYIATDAGRAHVGAVDTTEPHELLERGLIGVEGVRYEDFLPVSAAGIFASNLNQYGTQSTAAVRPAYTRATLEEIMGRPIVAADAVYEAIEAQSLLDAYADLGVLDRVAPAERERLERTTAGGTGALRTTR